MLITNITRHVANLDGCLAGDRGHILAGLATATSQYSVIHKYGTYETANNNMSWHEYAVDSFRA